VDLQKKIEDFRTFLRQAEQIQVELDRRIFHLKTLYDVSRDIYGLVETEMILRNFLLASMGNYGVMAGFILLIDPGSGAVLRFLQVGCGDKHDAYLLRYGKKFLLDADPGARGKDRIVAVPRRRSTIRIGILAPFDVEPGCRGVMGLGPKLTGLPYDDNDQELMDTLVNNVAVALKNALSFEKILALNKSLQLNNEELEKALTELRAAMRKVELLESIKSNLSKFVPATVCSVIEKSPTGDLPESREQDVSVLFVDVEGYTRLCEKLGSTKVGEVIEKSFSLFMDAIYANNGDVNETAGDGLMVIFHDEDHRQNALQAVRTAQQIRNESSRLEEFCRGFSERLVINMGINSGTALVGAAKFSSYTGSRWTYTARGTTTNLAARLGTFATNGRICVSKSTAERVKENFPCTYLGKFQLKNVSGETEIYEL